jgi:ATP-dependent protease HslVU (ClpYQ) peptidase subunit
LGYDDEFIGKVAHCILTHRGRAEPDPETLEAEIVACADAMAHFDTFLDLVPLFIKTNNGSFEKAVIELEKKMERNWERKLTLPEAKEIVKDKYEAIMILIKSMKEYI